MLSALRRRFLAGVAESESPTSEVRPGISAMSVGLQCKFKSGVDYNMKVLIRGDRNVGKSCLMERLQGRQFRESYEPTEEIQVASVSWNYKASSDVVKVDIWDIVDQSRRKRPVSNVLKLQNVEAELTEASLDASFIDIYQGANAVILMFDITKPWTWDYVKRELPSIPATLPVLVLGNRKDMESAREIPEDLCRSFINDFNRPVSSAPLRYAESSMRTGSGLKLLYVFLNLPFLLIEKATLLNRLRRNEEEMRVTFEEMELYENALDNRRNTNRQTEANKSPTDEQVHKIDAPLDCRPVEADGPKSNGKPCEEREIPQTVPHSSSPYANKNPPVVMSAQMADLNSWLDSGDETNGNAVLVASRAHDTSSHSESDDDQPNPLVTEVPKDSSDESDRENDQR
uniref:Miro domain-containing protein n=1 Tax=Trichuris muris TaxID=70415 RepID=A0A5S6QX51_TRIMR